jgi:hypothetical protein
VKILAATFIFLFKGTATKTHPGTVTRDDDSIDTFTAWLLIIPMGLRTALLLGVYLHKFFKEFYDLCHKLVLRINIISAPANQKVGNIKYRVHLAYKGKVVCEVIK